MKKIMMMALAAMLCVGSMSAQRPEGRGRMSVEDRVAGLKKQLGLNDEQTAQVKAIMEDFGAQARKNMENREKMSREEMRAQMMAQRDSLNSKIEKVLNDKQKAAYKKMQEAEAKRMQRGPRGPRPGGER